MQNIKFINNHLLTNLNVNIYHVTARLRGCVKTTTQPQIFKEI